MPVNAITEDIKIFLDNYPRVSFYWVNRLGNMVAHKSAHWVFNVIRSGSSPISKIPPTIENLCNHEQLLISHKRAHWIFNVIRSGCSSISKIPPTTEIICNYEELLI